MFYTKRTIGAVTIKNPIHCDNVFTVCPKCGREFMIDLEEFMEEEYFDLNCTVLCEECSAKEFMKERKANAKKEPDPDMDDFDIYDIYDEDNGF